MMTVVLLGASGYVGTAFAHELELRGEDAIPVSRRQVDYTNYARLVELLRETRADFLINAAGFTGRPNVDACEKKRAETLMGNTLLAGVVSDACQATATPWGHVSSGCIYNGAWIREGNVRRIESDLTKPELQPMLTHRSKAIEGFREGDEPNFSFRNGPCSFYSGTKALAEEVIQHDDSAYVWRLRIPFDEHDSARNYLSKLQRYPRIYDNFNSLSHLADYVSACLDLWQRGAPPGVYNVTNPGYVSSREVVQMIQQTVAPRRTFDFWEDDSEFYTKAAKAPRSNCILDVGKLSKTGVTMRPVEDALADALSNWQLESNSAWLHQVRCQTKQTTVSTG